MVYVVATERRPQRVSRQQTLAVCPSGQREQTVNLPAQPSQVRILAPPQEYKGPLICGERRSRAPCCVLSHRSGGPCPAGGRGDPPSHPRTQDRQGGRRRSADAYASTSRAAASAPTLEGADCAIAGTYPDPGPGRRSRPRRPHRRTGGTRRRPGVHPQLEWPAELHRDHRRERPHVPRHHHRHLDQPAQEPQQGDGLPRQLVRGHPHHDRQAPRRRDQGQLAPAGQPLQSRRVCARFKGSAPRRAST